MKKFVVLILLLLLFVMTSCQNENSLFWAVTNAVKQIDNSLDNDLTIQDMVSDGSNYYLASFGTMWKKSVSAASADEWTEISLPDGADYCTALEYDSANSLLYLGVFMENGSGALFSSGDDGSTWTKIPDYDGYQILDLWDVNNQLLVSDFDPSLGTNMYSLSFCDGNRNVTGVNNVASPVIGVVYDTANYYVLLKNTVYGAGDLASLSTGVNKPDTTDKFQDIFYSSGGTYYISTDNGRVYSSSDFSTWTSSDVQSIYSVNVSFLGFGEVNGNVLVGTSNYGFFQMKDGNVSSLERPGELLNSDMYYFYVKRFYVNGNKVFFITGSKGLFFNTYDGSSWGENWTWE